MGLEQPYAWIGKLVKSILEGIPAPIVEEEKEMLAAPVIYPEAQDNAPAGGLYLNQEAQVIIKSAQMGGNIRYTVDGNEPTKNSSLYQAPFTINESKVVKAKVFVENKESYTAQAFFRIATTSDHGITFSYYTGGNWNKLPDFENMKPAATGKVYEFRIDSIAKAKKQFAIKFESILEITHPGAYTFYTNSDDGSKLIINNKEVVDNDGVAHDGR